MYMPNNFKNKEVIVFNPKLIKKKIYSTLKRLMDILIASIGALLSIPIIIFAAILIKFESKGPCFYSQIRVGKNGRLFKLYKLRSMCVDAEREGPQWARKNDPRITKIGRYIRMARIDEIPQFFNVLKGEMSIVGPRPERLYFIDVFSKDIPEYDKRLTVKPGLTGWAQVNGGYELFPKEKLEKDLYYIENQSIWLDIKIIFKTIKIILSGHGAR